MDRFWFLWQTIYRKDKRQIYFKYLQRGLILLILLTLFSLLGLDASLHSHKSIKPQVVFALAVDSNQSSWPRVSSPHVIPLSAPLYGGNPLLPEVALTFDDGPEPGSTPQIVAILKRFGVNATFFCVGLHAHWFPDLVRQEYANGNLVEDHTWTHADLQLLKPDDVAKQLTSTADEIQQLTGTMPTLFRPPYGFFNWPIFAQAHRMAFSSILWNVAPMDWLAPGTDVIIKRVLSATRNGSIILLHDGSPDDRLDRSQTVAALPAIITGLRQRGFRFVTVEQMIRDLGQKTPGVQTSTGQGTQALAMLTWVPGLQARRLPELDPGWPTGVTRRKGLAIYGESGGGALQI